MSVKTNNRPVYWSLLIIYKTVFRFLSRQFKYGEKKKSISKKLGNENGLYAGVGGSAFVQGKRAFFFFFFCISCVESSVSVSKCWHRAALFLVLSHYRRSQEFRACSLKSISDAGK